MRPEPGRVAVATAGIAALYVLGFLHGRASGPPDDSWRCGCAGENEFYSVRADVKPGDVATCVLQHRPTRGVLHSQLARCMRRSSWRPPEKPNLASRADAWSESSWPDGGWRDESRSAKYADESGAAGVDDGDDEAGAATVDDEDDYDDYDGDGGGGDGGESAAAVAAAPSTAAAPPPRVSESPRPAGPGAAVGGVPPPPPQQQQPAAHLHPSSLRARSANGTTLNTTHSNSTTTTTTTTTK